jgi:hypothetical protein
MKLWRVTVTRHESIEVFVQADTEGQAARAAEREAKRGSGWDWCLEYFESGDLSSVTVAGDDAEGLVENSYPCLTVGEWFEARKGVDDAD